MNSRGCHVHVYAHKLLLPMIVFDTVLQVIDIVLIAVILRGIQRGGAWAAANNARKGNRSKSLEARSLSKGLGMNVRSQRKRLLLVYFVRVHRGFQSRHTLGVLGKLRVVDLAALGLRLGRLSLLLLLLVMVGCLVGQVLLLGDDGPAVHPVESYEERWINLGHLGGLD